MTGSIRLPSAIVSRYRRFSRFNSPYPAHDAGCAIDLYPAGEDGISPVSGTVRETYSVGCPDRSYAVSEDHLIVVDLDEEWCRRTGAEPGTVARILHVIPDVDPGDRVTVGDSLGPMTRSGFFGRWVDDHVHLGFRSPGANALRASGSLPVEADVRVASVPWDGTGTVVERGPSHVVLDAPAHPAPGERFAAIASDGGVPLDGGLAHYAGGGAFAPVDADETVSLWGTRVGTATGRGIAWEPIDVTVNGTRVTGLSLFAARDDDYGAKVVVPDHELVVGDTVSVGIEPSDDPIRLGVG
ncbi:hypothetical protein DQW50_16725 [Halorubrum sp. 48-1-W]|uniref:hypothetical protein n=1 Tax=Halorubrum sp. 48-1-W TaxID=2249761 RepID=UPI000DCC5FD0|nr:hypothetical protein [Halorubrum sp. 48-1-W]RAW44008.1 hypothetical protein DQW50_16725 [Halorubrum sp. 48-1-W]